MSKKVKKVVRSKIDCVDCGTTFGCRPDVFDKRAEKAGGVDELLASYQCRACRKGEEASTPSKPKAVKKPTLKDLKPEADVEAFMADTAEAETVEA